MRYASLIIFLFSCGLPSQEDLDNTLTECRMIVEDQIPYIVAQVTLNVLPALITLAENIDALKDDEIPDAVAHKVLGGMGCYWDGFYWDCSNALICGSR